MSQVPRSAALPWIRRMRGPAPVRWAWSTEAMTAMMRIHGQRRAGGWRPPGVHVAGARGAQRRGRRHGRPAAGAALGVAGPDDGARDGGHDTAVARVGG